MTVRVAPSNEKLIKSMFAPNLAAHVIDQAVEEERKPARQCEHVQSN